jgi:hypothetical protein
MAGQVGDDDRFFEENKLPSRPLYTSIRASYAAMADASVGGLLVTDDELPIYCATAIFLRALIMKRSEIIGIPAASIGTIGGYLIQYLSQEDWRETIMKTVREAGREQPLVIDIEYEPIRHDQDPEALGPPEPPRIYKISSNGSRRGGYFITSRQAQSYIFTPGQTYVCEDDHRTTHWDTGKCPQKTASGKVCGKPLKLTV